MVIERFFYAAMANQSNYMYIKVFEEQEFSLVSFRNCHQCFKPICHTNVIFRANIYTRE